MELHSLPDTIEEAKEYLANFNETSSKETAEGLVLREAIDKELQRRYSFIPSAAVRPLTEPPAARARRSSNDSSAVC